MLRGRKAFSTSVSAHFHFFRLSCVILVSSGGIILTQSPASLAASQEERGTIPCGTSTSISSSNLNWYQQKPGVSPKRLVYGIASLASGLAACLRGRGFGNPYSVTIIGVEAEGAAQYCCQQGAATQSVRDQKKNSSGCGQSALPQRP